MPCLYIRSCLHTSGKRSLVFHHVRTIELALSDGDLRYHGTMVGSKTARRLFLSEFVNGTTVIHRISTVSGQIDLSWTVGGECDSATTIPQRVCQRDHRHPPGPQSSTVSALSAGKSTCLGPLAESVSYQVTATITCCWQRQTSC